MYPKIIAHYVVMVLMVVTATFAAIYPSDNALSASEIRDKRQHHHGITGPVQTFVKTDKHANFKWGVRHHVGHEYAGRR